MLSSGEQNVEVLARSYPSFQFHDQDISYCTKTQSESSLVDDSTPSAAATCLNENRGHGGDLESIPATEKVTFPNQHHVCPICSESFPKRCVLLYHFKTRHTKHLASYTCDHCPNLSFTRLSSLIAHQNRIHYDNITCKRCGQSYGTDEAVFSHTCIEKRPYVCEGCGAGYTQLDSLNVHCQTCDDYSYYSPVLREYHYCYKGSYACHSCGLNFTKFSEIIQHRIKDHVKSSSSSLNCVSESPHAGMPQSKISYNIDESIVDVLRKYCKETGRSKHVRQCNGSHSDSGCYSCQFCHASFINVKSLDYHISSKHPFQSGKVHLCNTCGLYCISNAHLRHHQQSAHHHMSFGDSNTRLVESMLIASNDDNKVAYNSLLSPNSHQCQFCGVVFLTAFSLTRHINQRHASSPAVQILSPQKLNRVPLPDEFSLSPPLPIIDLSEDKPASQTNVNLLIQSKPYRCHLCLKSFKQRKYLKVHMKNIHNSIVCSKDLKKHEDLQKDKKSIQYVKQESNSSSGNRPSFKLSKKPNPQLDGEIKQDSSMIKASKDSYKCHLCRSAFDTHCLLLVHERTAHSRKDVSESSLEHPASKKRRLEKNLNEPNDGNCDSVNDKLFKCSACDKTYASKCSVRRHFRKVHINNVPATRNMTTNHTSTFENNGALFKCCYCGRVYAHHGSLKKHQKKFHSECDLSKEDFQIKSKNNLTGKKKKLFDCPNSKKIISKSRH